MIQTHRWTPYLVLYCHWILHLEIIPHQEKKQYASKLNTRNVQCSFSIIWCLHQQNGWSQHQSVMHTWFQCPLVALNHRGWPLAHSATAVNSPGHLLWPPPQRHRVMQWQAAWHFGGRAASSAGLAAPSMAQPRCPSSHTWNMGSSWWWTSISIYTALPPLARSVLTPQLSPPPPNLA